jgi:peroxiredoxin
MRRRVLLLCVTLGGCVTTGGAVNVPTLGLQDIDGRMQYLSDHIGQKVVVMSFWATWCQPCRQELLVLQELYDKHRDRLEVLAISTDGPETQAGVRSFVRQHNLTFQVLLDSETRAAALYNPRKQMPMMHIFDKSGRIVYSHATFQPGEAAALRARILRVLDGQSGDEPEEKKEPKKRPSSDSDDTESSSDEK